MPKPLPTNLFAPTLVKALSKIGYMSISQRGSHIKLKKDGKRPITIPNHKPVRLGTLRSILTQVAAYEECSLDELLGKLGL